MKKKGTIITACQKSKYITMQDRNVSHFDLTPNASQESDTTCWRVKWWRVRHNTHTCWKWHRVIRSATKCSSPQGPLTLKRSTRIPYIVYHRDMDSLYTLDGIVSFRSTRDTQCSFSFITSLNFIMPRGVAARGIRLYVCRARLEGSWDHVQKIN